MAYKDKDKEREHSKRYYLENKEKMNAKAKQYYLENKEHITQYLLKNKEKRKAYSKQYYLENKEKRNARGKQHTQQLSDYYIANLEGTSLKKIKEETPLYQKYWKLVLEEKRCFIQLYREINKAKQL